VAWCEECARLVEDEDLDDGACPRCGTVLEERERTGRRRYPWTFRFMIAASVVYLGYRSYQGITWVIHHV
jgi:uncharacterized paraquat-inducible protein A